MPEVGMDGQLKLKQAKGPAGHAPAGWVRRSAYISRRLESGRIGLVDFDVVDFTAILQRQVI